VTNPLGRGSSKDYAPTSDSPDATGVCGSEFLSTDPNVNPFIHDWVAVFVMYCDGTSFTGNVIDPVSLGGDPKKNFTYHGAWIRDAIIEDLATNHALSLATDVAIGGCSSGGHTIYVNIDYLAILVHQYAPLAAVTSLADGGFFLDHTTYQGKEYVRTLFEWGFVAWNATGALLPACIAAYPVLQGWKCYFPQYFTQFITTPTFVLNSRFDTAQLGYIDLLPQVTTWNSYNADQQGYAELYAQDFNVALNTSAIWTNPRSGGFLTSCMIHCMAGGSYYLTYLAPARNGSGNLSTISNAYNNWLQGNVTGVDAWWVVDPSLLPNQTRCG